MSRTEIIDYLFKSAPNGRIKISTKERKDLLLNDSCTFIWQGNLREIKFVDWKGGVWEAHSEPYKK